MARENIEKPQTRKAIKRAYVEYSKSGTRLSRLFRPEVFRGPMVDVNKEGVQFRATQALEVGESLYMTLRFAEVPEAIKLKAVVRWVREEKKVGIENYTHVVGAEFTDFTPQAWDLIAAAIKE